MSRTKTGHRLAYILLGAENSNKHEQHDDRVLAIESVDKVIAATRSILSDYKLSQIFKYLKHSFTKEKILFVALYEMICLSLSRFVGSNVRRENKRYREHNY